MKIFLASFLSCSIALSAMGQKSVWEFRVQESKKQIDVLCQGKVMTSYCYYDSVMKPILFPIRTVSGIVITRGWPIAPHQGDHIDHPHHTGLWLNYESVNGFDFWNNSPAIPADKRGHYGKIVHDKLLTTEVKDREARMATEARWIAGGETLIHETTQYTFQRNSTELIIDRTTMLKADAQDVVFKDVKDGFLGLRVASELEMPSKVPLEFLDVHGNATKIERGGEPGTGMYTTSKGVKGDAAWGTRGNWCVLSGQKDHHEISICIIDHPENVGYPTYWHARGYGLFAANPLGQEVFSQGKEKLNYTLPSYQAVTFRYRIVITSEVKFSADRANALAEEFAMIH